MIIRALIREGKLHPLDPLPAEWVDGRTVELSGYVEPPEDPEEFERRWQELEAVIAETPDDPEDWKKVQECLAQQKRLSKDYVRKQMGLPE